METKIELLDKYKGCFIGLACGDYLGMPVEFSRGREDVIKYFGKHELRPIEFLNETAVRKTAGYYTDDTCMAMCLAESLHENDFDIKDQFRRYKKWLFEGYNTPFGDKSYGVGNHTFKMLTSLNEDDLPTELDHHEMHGGNGALMKCAPIGLYYFDDIALLKDNSIKSAIITHNNSDAAWSCVVLNSFIAYALLGHKKENFAGLYLQHHQQTPDKIKDLLLKDYISMPDRENLNNSGFTLHTLQIALYSFLRSNNFVEAVTEAIFMGGDADTQGAVVGSLAGAYYGHNDIPTDWISQLLNKEYIEQMAINLYNKKVSS